MSYENQEKRSQSFTSSCARITFAVVRNMPEFCLQCAGVLFAACWSFVSSVREFRLQRAGVLFAACWSFVCSVLEFRLQRAGVLFAACNSFACSVYVFFYSFFFVCFVQERIFLTRYLCLQGIYLFAVFSLCENGVPCGPPYKGDSSHFENFPSFQISWI